MFEECYEPQPANPLVDQTREWVDLDNKIRDVESQIKENQALVKTLRDKQRGLGRRISSTVQPPEECAQAVDW